MPRNFALIGCAGYIAPRHLEAIKNTQGNLVATVDPSDSVGILDRYFPEADFFTEFERFERHVEKLKRRKSDNKIDYVSICSPNYLHDSHVRFAFRHDSDAICEKPLVIRPSNLDGLLEVEQETGKRVYCVLQLRHHPAIANLKKTLDSEKITKKHDVELTYVTPRGNWYKYSWKGNIEKSGGIGMNLGIHFFDMLSWVFGTSGVVELHHSDGERAGGYIEMEKANVRWFLSTNKEDNPRKNGSTTPYRSIKIDGKELEFSEGFKDLHTVVYQNIFSGTGWGINDARASIELADRIRESSVGVNENWKVHEFLEGLLNKK